MTHARIYAESVSPRARPSVGRALWRELRPRQWVKNLFVLAPALFSESLTSPDAASRSLAAFVLFCLVSSSVYVFNDLLDLDRDRAHPAKNRRPLAAGELSPRLATLVSGLLVATGLGLGLAVAVPFGLVLGAYWLLNLVYSLHLKHQVILDVFAIAASFVLRVVGGALAIEVAVSHWLIVCTMLLALFLGFAKRRHELVTLDAGGTRHREVLVEYDRQFLDMMIGIVSASTVMSYALYTVSAETVAKFQTDALLWTLPFVLYGVFRYLYLAYHREAAGDPTTALWQDPPMRLNLLLWASSAALIIYL